MIFIVLMIYFCGALFVPDGLSSNDKRTAYKETPG